MDPSLVQLVELRSLLFDHRLIVEFARALARIAIPARRNEVHYVAATASRHWLDVIRLENNLWRRTSAILASERVALEKFKAQFFADWFAFAHLYIVTDIDA